MELPLFPLHLVLFPGRPLPLHLFEARYREMLRDCMSDDRRFGVVAIRSGEEIGHRAEIHRVGTVAEIRTVKELADGRYDIIARGAERFRVVRTLDDRDYLRAEVEIIPDGGSGNGAAEAAAMLQRLLVENRDTLGLPNEFCAHLPEDPLRLSYVAAASLRVDKSVHQQLLELGGPSERLLETARIIKREAGLIRHLGHFTSFVPRRPGGAQLN